MDSTVSDGEDDFSRSLATRCAMHVPQKTKTFCAFVCPDLRPGCSISGRPVSVGGDSVKQTVTLKEYLEARAS